VTKQWSEVSHWIVDEVNRRGYLAECSVRQTSWEAIKDIGANPSWAANSSGVAERARKYLNWQPVNPALKDTIPDAVRVEADALGLKPKE
jgi:hypothetical protein